MSSPTDEITFESCKDFCPLSENQKVKVVKVIDGDTLWVSWKYDSDYVKYKLRIRNIDTPEMKSKNTEERLMAQNAKQILSEKCLNQEINVYDVSLDKYGRVLADFSTFDLPSMSEFMLTKSDICHAYKGGKKEVWVFPSSEETKDESVTITETKTITEVIIVDSISL